MSSRALPLVLAVAIVAILAIGAYLLDGRSGPKDGTTQCKTACLAGCERDLECGGAKLDCNDVCTRQCQGAPLRAFDDVACVEKIKALGCADAARLSLGDTSMLSGACGVQ